MLYVSCFIAQWLGNMCKEFLMKIQGSVSSGLHDGCFIQIVMIQEVREDVKRGTWRGFRGFCCSQTSSKRVSSLSIIVHMDIKHAKTCLQWRHKVLFFSELHDLYLITIYITNLVRKISNFVSSWRFIFLFYDSKLHLNMFHHCLSSLM